MNPSTRTWITRGALLLVCAIAYYFMLLSVQRAKEGYSMLPVPTSYNTGPFGAKAFYLLLRKANFDLVRNTKPIAAIPNEVGTLVMLEPEIGFAVMDKEWNSITRWVESGHSLLLAISTIGPAMGWEASSHTENWNGLEPHDTDLEPVNVSRFAQSVRSVRALKNVELRRRYRSTHDYEEILSEGDQVRVAAMRKGRGWIVVASDASLFTNRLIAQQDNALLILNVLQVLSEPSGSRKVWIDEYHHGYSTANSLPQLVWKTPVRWIALQTALALLIFLYSEGKRFGHPIVLTPERDRPRSGRFVSSMANIYRKAGARDAAYAILRENFRRELMRLMHLSPSATLKDLLAVAERHDLNPHKLEVMLRSWTGGIDEASLLDYTRTLEEIKRRLLPGGRESKRP